MRNIKVYYLIIIFTLLVTGCAGIDKEKSPSNTKITIEPYNLSDKERLLISKTDVGRIEFFKLNGTLNKEEDLQFSVEVFENGKFKEELLQTWDAPEISYNESLISFGINNTTEEDHTVKLINGVPSGLATTYYPANMTSSSFGKLINEKMTLEKKSQCI